MAEKLKEDKEYLLTKIHSLIFIEGVAIHHDPLASKRRGLTQNNANYTLVSKEGDFITDGSGYRFFNSITVNEYGLFSVVVPTYFSTYYVDVNGVLLEQELFTKFFELLAKRNPQPPIVTYFMMEDEIKKSRFKIVSKPSHTWVTKEGSQDLPWGKRPDGLIYEESEESRRPDWTAIHHDIHDGQGNRISLSDYYWCFMMLENGRKYLRQFLDIHSTLRI